MSRRKTRPTYIGIDFSIRSPGIAINNGKTIVVDCLKTPPIHPKQENTKRLQRITNQIIRWIGEHNGIMDWSETKIFIEDYSFGAVGKTFDIAECVGILKYRLFFEYGLPFKNLFLVSIGHLKMFCTGKGNASKDTIIKEVYKRWEYDTNNNNKADAFVLLMMCKAYHKPNFTLTSFQIEALKRVKAYNEDKKKKKKKV